jgi:4'-phosphopantetheinyl transferase EntD
MEMSHCFKQPFFRGELRYDASICWLKAEAFPEDLVKYLHPTEMDKISTFGSPIRQKTFLMGRYCAKRALDSVSEAEVPLVDILIDKGIFEFPIVAHPKLSNYHVSIAHTDSCAVAVAFPHCHPISVDIEVASGDRHDTIWKQLSTDEKQLLSQLPIAIELASAIAWTAKESLSKILRTGLTAALEIYELSQIEIGENNQILCSFKYFFQYRTESHIIDECVFTLCLPKRSQMELGLFQAPSMVARPIVVEG